MTIVNVGVSKLSKNSSKFNIIVIVVFVAGATFSRRLLGPPRRATVES